MLSVHSGRVFVHRCRRLSVCPFGPVRSVSLRRRLYVAIQPIRLPLFDVSLYPTVLVSVSVVSSVVVQHRPSSSGPFRSFVLFGPVICLSGRVWPVRLCPSGSICPFHRCFVFRPFLVLSATHCLSSSVVQFGCSQCRCLCVCLAVSVWSVRHIVRNGSQLPRLCVHLIASFHPVSFLTFFFFPSVRRVFLDCFGSVFSVIHVWYV